MGPTRDVPRSSSRQGGGTTNEEGPSRRILLQRKVLSTPRHCNTVNMKRKGGRGGGSSSSNRNKPPLLVYTSDFDAMFQKCKQFGMVEPIKFKVHKPNCSCSKLVSRLLKAAGNVEYVEDSSSLSQSSENGGTLQNLQEDSLILHPDTEGIPCIFRWPIIENTNTGVVGGSRDGRQLKAEQCLQDHLNNYRFSCWPFSMIVSAACSLEDEPKGFACVMSSDIEILKSVRDVARQRIADSSEEGRDLDHADSNGKTKLEQVRATIQQTTKKKQGGWGRPPKTSATSPSIKSQIIQQGISLPKVRKRDRIEFELGHHLDAFLLKSRLKGEEKWLLVNGYIRANNENRTNDSTRSASNINDLTAVAAVVKLDISGGERRLGETSIQAAIRNSQEQGMRLVWDERWIVSFEQINECRFYLLHPPLPSSSSISPLQVYTSDFNAMYEKCKQLPDSVVELIQFNLHKKPCDCSNFLSGLEGRKLEHVEESASSSMISEHGTSLHYENNLILHPDSKTTTPCIFRCPIIAGSDGAAGQVKAEQSLQDHLDMCPSSCWPYSKIVRKPCLFANESENGFACVMSLDKSIVHSVKDMACQRSIAAAAAAAAAASSSEEERASMVQQHDGDFIVILRQSLLIQLRKSIPKEVREVVMAHIVPQCVYLRDKVTEEERDRIEVRLGQHLDALLRKMPKKKKKKQEQQQAEEPEYWLLVNGLFKNTDKSKRSTAAGDTVVLELNIPGGQRRLGETCCQVAKRKSLEQMNLVWDESWIMKQYPVLSNSNDRTSYDRVYALHPPAP
eukprot:scaffold22615_cov97-Cylindrotheca_fusiformis.AAC.3